MKIKKDRVVLSILILGIVMTAFTTALTTMSYRKVQADTAVHGGVLNAASMVRKLNYALSFGKPIDKFFGLSELMNDILDLPGDISGVEVVNSDGDRIEAVGDITDSVRRTTPDEEYTIRNDGVYAFVDFDGGEIVLKIDKSEIEAATAAYIRYIIRIDTYILFGIAVAAIIVCAVASSQGIGFKRMRVTSIVILLISQIALGAISMQRVDDSFLISLIRISAMTSRSIENDINKVVEKGVRYEEITGLDEYLEKLCGDIPELSAIYISDETQQTSANQSCYSIDIKGESGQKKYIVCENDRDYIKSKRINNAVDIIILLFITVFMSTESVNFITKNMEYKGRRNEGNLYVPGFRMFVFAQGIAFSLDSGFFSIYSNKMFIAMEISDQYSFLGGMPNTMFSISLLIGLFGCSAMIERIGMKKTLMGGIIAGIFGYIMCAFAPNLIFLIIARFIYGFCDGIIVNAIRLYAASQKDKEMHNKLLVEYMAAINLGVSCGVVIGGLIADVTSYTAVFLTGAAIGVLCLFLIYFAGFPAQKEKENKLSFAIALRELRFPQVRIFMIFAVIPLYMASLFVEYTFPLFGDEMNLSNSMVSGMLMVNFMLIAYLTDPISEWVMKRLKIRASMILYMTMQTISIGLFVITSSMWAAVLGVILTSLWDCFGMVAIDSALDHVNGTETEHSTLLQMVFGKLAMVIGPVAITSRLSMGAARATGVIVITLLIGTVVYGFSVLYFTKKYGPANKNAG